MDIIYKEPLSENSYSILRKAGYIPIRDRESGKESFILKVQGDRYPRFHLYLEEESETSLKWHLHWDKKKHGWSDRRHDTEYGGETVKEEADRLKRWLAHYTVKEESGGGDEKKPDDKTIGGFIAKLFG